MFMTSSFLLASRFKLPDKKKMLVSTLLSAAAAQPAAA